MFSPHCFSPWCFITAVESKLGCVCAQICIRIRNYASVSYYMDQADLILAFILWLPLVARPSSTRCLAGPLKDDSKYFRMMAHVVSVPITQLFMKVSIESLLAWLHGCNRISVMFQVEESNVGRIITKNDKRLIGI